MTATATVSPSQDSFWEASDLPPAEVLDDAPPNDDTHLINPPENVCPGCGEEIIRQPGQRGKLAKYHPECKPVKNTAASSGPRTVRVTAKDRAIAEQIENSLDMIDAKYSRAVMLLALADPYDALVLRINQSEFIENLRPAMYRFAWLREAGTNASAGASLVGLAITVLTTLLPIAAHHNLIPSKKVSKILLAIPMIMKRMQDNMSTNGEDITGTLIARVQEDMRKQNEARMRAQAQAENINASFTG